MGALTVMAAPMWSDKEKVWWKFRGHLGAEPGSLREGAAPQPHSALRCAAPCLRGSGWTRLGLVGWRSVITLGLLRGSSTEKAAVCHKPVNMASGQPPPGD